MSKLLTTITLLCISVEFLQNHTYARLLNYYRAHPNLQPLIMTIQFFVVDLEKGVSKLDGNRELGKFAGFCEVDKIQSVIQCQKVVLVSGKWLFSVDLSSLNFTYSQGYINGFKGRVNIGTCLEI